MRILRHPLPITDHQPVTLPHNGFLLSAAASRAYPDTHIDVWSLVEELGAPRTTQVYMFGTGHPVPAAIVGDDDCRFLGTVVAPNQLVWHVFEGPACHTPPAADR